MQQTPQLKNFKSRNMNLNYRETLQSYTGVCKIVLLVNLFPGTPIKYIFKKWKIHPQLPYLFKTQD
jgi:hypothetical protein